MAILDALGAYIDANTSLTLGTDLFLATMPDETPDQCVAVYEYEGTAPVETMGAAPFALDCPRIQVVVRGPMEDYEAARTLAASLRTLLASMPDGTYSGVRIVRIQSLGSLLPMGPDARKRPQITSNMQAWVE